MATPLAESEDFVQHLTSNLIKNLSFLVPITHLVKQHAQVAVTDEAKLYDQSVARAKQEDRATAPSRLPGCPQTRHTLGIK